MEQAINYYFPLAKKSDLDCNYKYNLRVASNRDDVDEFLRLIKDPRFETIRGSYDIIDLFEFDAVNCSIAVFEGKTQPYVDIPDRIPVLLLAASQCAPRVVKYLLDRGYTPDDLFLLNEKLSDPIALALTISMQYANPHSSLSQMFTKILFHYRPYMEIVRILVQQTQNKESVKQGFIDYLQKGKLGPFVVLFLAVPELLLSSLATLYPELKNREEKTHNEDVMLLLLEVLATVGDKLVAYVRLAETSKQSFYQTQLDTDFFLREVYVKRGDTLTDRYFRFHMRLGADQQSSQEEEGDDDDRLTWDEFEFEEQDMFDILPDFVSRKNFDQAHVFRQLPSLKPEDADRLKRAIEKKLSSMHLNLETITLISNEEKLVPMPSFRTTAASAKSSFPFKMSPANCCEDKVPSFHSEISTANCCEDKVVSQTISSLF